MFGRILEQLDHMHRGRTWRASGRRDTFDRKIGKLYRPNTKEVTLVVGKIPLGGYINNHHNRSEEYMSTHTIMVICLDSVQQKGVMDIQRLWDKGYGIRSSEVGNHIVMRGGGVK